MKDNELDDLLADDDELEEEDFATSINDFDDDNSFDDELEDEANIETDLKSDNELEDDLDDYDFDDNADFSELEDYEDDLNLGNFVIDDIIEADDFSDDEVEEVTQIKNSSKLRKIDNMRKEDSKYTLKDNIESVRDATDSAIKTIDQFLRALDEENRTTDENLNSVNKFLAGDIPNIGNKILLEIKSIYEKSIDYFFFRLHNLTSSRTKRELLKDTSWFITTPLRELYVALSKFNSDELRSSAVAELYNDYINSFNSFIKAIREESTIFGYGRGTYYSICEHLNCFPEANSLSKYLKTILEESIIERDKAKENSSKINMESMRFAKILIPNLVSVRNVNESNLNEYSIVDSVVVYQDRSTKVKCSCSNLFRVDYPLLSVFTLPVNINNKLELIELPTYATCPVCGKKNILSINARKMLMSAISKTFDREKIDLRDIKGDKGKEKLCNIIKYAPSTDLFVEYAPAYYITEAEMLERYNNEDGEDIDISDISLKKDVEKSEDDVISSTSQFLELINKPLNKYRDWVNYYRDSVDLLKNVQNIEDFSDYIDSTPLSSYEELYSTRLDLAGLTYKLYSNDGKYVTKKFSKLICGILGRNYIDYKKDAVNTLVEYLNNTSIVHDISLERLWITEAIVNSSESVKHMKELDPINKYRSAQTLYRIQGPKELDLGTELNPNSNNLDAYIDSVYNTIIKMKSEYQDMLDNRQKLLQDLKENTRVYSMIPLVRNTEVPDRHLDYLKLDDELKEFIDVTTDLMLLNNNIDNLVKYMESCAPRKDKASTTKKATLTNILKSVGDISRTDIIKKHLDLLYNLGLLNEDNKGNFTGIPERFNIALNLFTVVHFPPDTQGYDNVGGSPINNLLSLFELQEAMKRNNEFEIMNIINKLDWLDTEMIYYTNDKGTKVLSDKIYDTATYHTIFNAIQNLREVSKEFVKKYGSTSKDNLIYNLEGIFTKEEIDEGYSYVMDSIKLDRLLNRLDNETLSDYLDRLSKVDKEDPYEVFLRDDYKDKINENIVALEVCNIPMETAQSTNNAYKYFTFAELFILSIQTDLKLIANMFMIDSEIVGKLSTSDDYIYGEVNKDDYRLKTLVEYCIYLNAEYNIGNYFTDLPQVEDADLEDSSEKEIDILTKMDFYKADEASYKAFQDSGKYIEKGVFNEINDYINGGKEG